MEILSLQEVLLNEISVLNLVLNATLSILAKEKYLKLVVLINSMLANKKLKN